MATLLDRFIGPDDRMVLRVQHSRTGGVFDVFLPNESDGVREYAGCIWGGNSVDYVMRAGVAILDCDPDLMSAAEFAAFDRRDEIRGARNIALGASDSEIEAILDTPMSHRQRRDALAKLAK